MPKAFFRDVRAGYRKAAIADLDSIARKEVERVLDQRVKPALVKSHEKVVEDWTTKVTFQARKVLKPNRIIVYVYPTGKNKKIWYYVDLGTKPHPITAKRAPTLAFMMHAPGGKPVRGGYVPKTRPIAKVVSGGGYVKTPKTLVRPVTVNHPGSEGRNFTGQIAEDIKPAFRREVENAFRRTARKCEE